nr:NAC domain-containing protein 86 isoform X1 [Ipomoea trifida]
MDTEQSPEVNAEKTRTKRGLLGFPELRGLRESGSEARDVHGEQAGSQDTVRLYHQLVPSTTVRIHQNLLVPMQAATFLLSKFEAARGFNNNIVLDKFITFS